MSQARIVVAVFMILLFHIMCFAQGGNCARLDGLVLDVLPHSGNDPQTGYITLPGLEVGDVVGASVEDQTTGNVAINVRVGGSDIVTAPHTIENDGDNPMISYTILGSFLQPDFEVTFTCTNSMAVELVSLMVVANGLDVDISWSTDSETDNDGFKVQRRCEDGKYETIGFVEGAGTTIDQQSYEYRVEDLDFGTHTFRLKQIDLDGGYTYSDEVEVLIEVPDLVATEGAYPNPFNPSTTLRFAVSTEQSLRVTLHDIQGRIVKELGDVQATPHEMQRIQIDGAGLSSGVYLVRLEGEYFATTEQIALVK